MTIWEKTIVNMQKGVQKITAGAAVFSERVKAEITIVGIRIKIGEAQARIDELYRTIGRKVVDLNGRDVMPKASEELLKDEDIAAAMSEFVERKKEIEDLKKEIKSGQEALKPVPKQREDNAV